MAAAVLAYLPAALAAPVISTVSATAAASVAAAAPVVQAGQHQTGDPVTDPGSLGQVDRPRAGLGGSPAQRGGGVSGGAGDVAGGAVGGGASSADVGGGTTPGSPVVPGGSIPAGGVPTVAAVPTNATFAPPSEMPPWLVWWDLNRHRYLDVRGALATAGTTTGSSDFFLGDGETRAATPDRSTAPALPDELLASLLVAASDDDPRLAVEAMIALGQLSEHWTDDSSLHSIRTVLATRASDPSMWVADSAVEALAIGASDRDLQLLAALVLDEERGRTWVGAGEVPPQRRALAALGLGRLASVTVREDVRRLAAHYLVSAYQSAPRNRPELAAACLVALAQVPLERIGLRDPAGLPEPPSQSRIALLRFVVEQLENRRRLDDTVLIHVPAAIAIAYDALPAEARPGLERALTEPLLDPLERPRRLPDAFVQNAIAAAGDLADLDDDKLDSELRDALVELADAADARTRTSALLALGELLGRSPTTAPNEAFDELSELLVDSVTRGRTSDRPAAALALGVAGAELRARGELVPSRWTVTLRAALAQSKNPEERIAIALASGILRDTAAEAGVVAAFDRSPARHDQSRLAVALGLLRSQEALGLLRESLDDMLTDASSTRRTAEAAALCGDLGLPARLIDALDRSGSRVQRVALIEALAAVGGRSELEPLIARLGDETIDAGERARVARALGRIADTETRPWCADFAEHLVVPGAAPAFHDGQGGGVLARLP